MAAARCTLGRLPEKVASAVVEFCYGSLAANPYRVGKPLRLGLAGLHSARRGDYRVIYRIDDQSQRIDIVAIEHRADVYPASHKIQRRDQAPATFRRDDGRTSRLWIFRGHGHAVSATRSLISSSVAASSVPILPMSGPMRIVRNTAGRGFDPHPPHWFRRFGGRRAGVGAPGSCQLDCQ
jgi:mRNA interferase RelE/StbE